MASRRAASLNAVAEVLRFPVLTPGDLQGNTAGINALYRPLPDNPSFELLDLAHSALLDYYSFLVNTHHQCWWWQEPVPAIDLAEARLNELRALMTAWHRRQWLRLGAP